MKIAGFTTGHDVSYCILENGIPIVHNELERFNRVKMTEGDAMEFLLQTYDGKDNIKHITHCNLPKGGGVANRYPESYKRVKEIVEKNSGQEFIPGHHQGHAANAFFSSNFDEALIITIDGGGHDWASNDKITSLPYNSEGTITTAFTVWKGKGNKIHEIDLIPIQEICIGAAYGSCTKNIFGLSEGPPIGNQSGTVMGMACLGDGTKYYKDFLRTNLNPPSHLTQIAQRSEQDRFDVAASLQKATEIITKKYLDKYLEKYKYKYLCLSGGVALNSVIAGKLFDWYPWLEDIYVDPVPYDAGLAIGSARYVWHHILDNPRIKWVDDSSPYLGYEYHKDEIYKQLKLNIDTIKYVHVNDDFVVDLLANDDNVISVYGGGSESGRRALGNRSILADPRSDKMKDVINAKVKHRQWFRPFAPSILREEVKNWFERDISSPYMGFAIPFKEEVRDKIPAVVHFDGTGRLQTVTENNNKWYYNFIKKFKEKTGVPILLNTSFNDREPIVETPEHAINCFLGTNIDYLYFTEYGILVSKNNS
jgi:carbamoyltransferase